MSSPLDWSLIDGAVPIVLAAAMFVVLAVLLWVRRRTWWTRTVPLCLGISAAIVVVMWLLFHDEWKPFPRYLWGWIGLTVLTVALVVARMRPARWPGRVLMVFAVLLSLVGTAAQINACYAMYTTTRILAAAMFDRSQDLGTVRGPDSSVVRPQSGKPLDEVWQAPAGMSANGSLFSADIPSSTGFQAGKAWLYLPPAYLSSPRAELPVMVMLGGDPGSARQWINGGHLGPTLDAFANSHEGLAPVVVMADVQGPTYPMCLDSNLGKTDTYLAKDVPAWITKNLQVAADHRHWGIGGLSSGGTCSLQMAVRHPDVYQTFLDFSGQREPTIGTRQQTVDKAFGGDMAAFTAVNPLDIMRRTRFPGTAGIVAVGRDDSTFRPQQQEVFAACQAAGMDVQWNEVPGGHTFVTWRSLFGQSVPWLAKRMELIR
jgi:enterochelin esterase-like enzyme